MYVKLCSFMKAILNLHAFYINTNFEQQYLSINPIGFMVYGLWCLMSLSTIFQLYGVVSFLEEETRVPRKNYQPVTSHLQTLSHNVVLSTPHHERGCNSQLKW